MKSTLKSIMAVAIIFSIIAISIKLSGGETHSGIIKIATMTWLIVVLKVLTRKMRSIIYGAIEKEV